MADDAARPTDDDGPDDGDGEVGYAGALAELETILAELEADTVDVDRLADQVQRASELIRICRGRLRDARVQVEQIVAELEEP
jgi:exodeoxyribonuclease VII small subunit